MTFHVLRNLCWSGQFGLFTHSTFREIWNNKQLAHTCASEFPGSLFEPFRPLAPEEINSHHVQINRTYASKQCETPAW